MVLTLPAFTNQQQRFKNLKQLSTKETLGIPLKTVFEAVIHLTITANPFICERLGETIQTNVFLTVFAGKKSVGKRSTLWMSAPTSSVSVVMQVLPK